MKNSSFEKCTQLAKITLTRPPKVQPPHMIGGSKLYSIKTAESRQETRTTTKVLKKDNCRIEGKSAVKQPQLNPQDRRCKIASFISAFEVYCCPSTNNFYRCILLKFGWLLLRVILLPLLGCLLNEAPIQ